MRNADPASGAGRGLTWSSGRAISKEKLVFSSRVRKATASSRSCTASPLILKGEKEEGVTGASGDRAEPLHAAPTGNACPRRPTSGRHPLVPLELAGTSLPFRERQKARPAAGGRPTWMMRSPSRMRPSLAAMLCGSTWNTPRASQHQQTPGQARGRLCPAATPTPPSPPGTQSDRLSGRPGEASRPPGWARETTQVAPPRGPPGLLRLACDSDRARQGCGSAERDAGDRKASASFPGVLSEPESGWLTPKRGQRTPRLVSTPYLAHENPDVVLVVRAVADREAQLVLAARPAQSHLLTERGERSEPCGQRPGRTVHAKTAVFEQGTAGRARAQGLSGVRSTSAALKTVIAWIPQRKWPVRHAASGLPGLGFQKASGARHGQDDPAPGQPAAPPRTSPACLVALFHAVTFTFPVTRCAT